MRDVVDVVDPRGGSIAGPVDGRGGDRLAGFLVLTTIGSVHAPIPESASEHAKLTVTSVVAARPACA